MGSPRPFIIDGYNVAMEHGRGDHSFSCKGIWLAINHMFQRSRSCFILLILPCGQKPAGHNVNVTEPHLIEDLREKFSHDRFQIFYSPLKYATDEIGRPRVIRSYDERLIVEVAHMLGGLVVSNDHYPSCAEYPEWAETLHSRVISYSWCRDIFHLVVDPLGRAGPEVLDVNVFADGETLPTNFFRVPETLTVAGYIAECLHLKKPSYLATEHQKLFGVSSNLQRCDYHRSASTEEEVRISPDLGFVNQDHSNATRFIAPLLEPVQNYLVNSILTAAEQAGLVVSACSADSGVSVGINRSLSQHLTDISIDGDVINGARLPPEHPQTPPSNEKPLMEENFVTIEDELMALMWNHKQLFDDLCGLYPNNIAQIETFMHANPEVTDVLELIEKIFHL